TADTCGGGCGGHFPRTCLRCRRGYPFPRRPGPPTQSGGSWMLCPAPSRTSDRAGTPPVPRRARSCARPGRRAENRASPGPSLPLNGAPSSSARLCPREGGSPDPSSGGPSTPLSSAPGKSLTTSGSCRGRPHDPGGVAQLCRHDGGADVQVRKELLGPATDPATDHDQGRPQQILDHPVVAL